MKKEEKEGPPLPLRATGIVLGLWIAVFLTIAFFVIPALFASWMPTGNPVPSATP